jgi:uncharacterized protein
MIYKNISSGIIEDVDDVKGIVTGYFSAFNNIDSDGDVIVSGAYKKTVGENGPMGRNRIMHLLQHNPLMPLAKPMELMEDAKGLRFVSKITETSYGKDVIKLYSEGVFNEHSVGFEIVKSDNKAGYREIREIKLWEGSTVTWGANPNTPIESMKSWDKPKSEEMIAKFCGILRNGDVNRRINDYLRNWIKANTRTFKGIGNKVSFNRGIRRKSIRKRARPDVSIGFGV